MNLQQPKIDLKNKFELYLEGVRVDFLAINISETEGGIPAASITFPVSSGVLRLLPGTIVQVFGYHFREDETYLMFEGELTSVNYQRTDTSRIVVLKAISLLGSMIKAKFRPADAIISKDMKDATGVQGGKIILYNNGEFKGPTRVGDIDDLKDTEDDVISGSIKDLSITAAFNLFDEFNKLLAEDAPGGKGDFIPMLQQFNLNFELNDLFYGLRSLAYKFGRTIFASPNPDLLNKIKLAAYRESWNNLKSGVQAMFTERPYTLMQLITEFQRYLHYNFITPAAYTAHVPFYLEKEQKELEPLRMIYLPSIETGPPALCNIFFPEQVSTFTYSREMMGEPTRVVGRATTSLVQQNKTTIDWTPVFAYPSLEFDEEKLIGNFTYEETYRGINYKVVSYQDVQDDLLTRFKTTEKNGKKSAEGEITEQDIKGDLGRLIRPYIYMDWVNMRYSGRTASLSTEWSPYRMIGVPGLMLDTDGLSIVGVVSSIETSISANGEASSRITMRNTRLVHDGEFEKTEFSTPATNVESGNERFIIHDLTYDGTMSTHELSYYQDLYEFTKIGKDVYTYILHGAISKNKGYYDTTTKGIFEDYKDRLDYEITRLPVHPRIDNSVLFFISNTDGSFNVEIPEHYAKSKEVRNTYLLYKSIAELRKAYDKKRFVKKGGEQVFDMAQLYTYMDVLNKRSVITKRDYFNFIGAIPNRKLEEDDAHDPTIVFGNGAQDLRDELQKTANVQYEQVVTTEIADLTVTRYRLASAKARYNRLTSNGLHDTFEKLEAHVNTYRTNAADAKREAEERWAEIQAAAEEIEKYTKQLEEIENPAKTTTTTTTTTREGEMCKPYNMTRRMHVRLAFRNTSDIVVDDTKLNLVEF